MPRRHRDRSDNRHAELGRQSVEIDLDAAPARNVDHVEHEQHRPPDPLQLNHQPQRHPQIGRIRHTEQQIGRRLARQPA